MTFSLVNQRSGFAEVPAQALRLSGGASLIAVGTVASPAVALTDPAHKTAGLVEAPQDWDAPEDVTVLVVLALAALQLDADTLDLDFEYTFTVPGGGGGGDLGKTSTTITPRLTVTTAGGLVAESLYMLSFMLDRADVNNGYAGATAGCFSFRINPNAASVVTDVSVLSIGLVF